MPRPVLFAPAAHGFKRPDSTWQLSLGSREGSSPEIYGSARNDTWPRLPPGAAKQTGVSSSHVVKPHHRAIAHQDCQPAAPWAPLPWRSVGRRRLGLGLSPGTVGPPPSVETLTIGRSVWDGSRPNCFRSPIAKCPRSQKMLAQPVPTRAYLAFRMQTAQSCLVALFSTVLPSPSTEVPAFGLDTGEWISRAVGPRSGLDARLARPPLRGLREL